MLYYLKSVYVSVTCNYVIHEYLFHTMSPLHVLVCSIVIMQVPYCKLVIGEVHNLFLKLIKDIIRTKVIKCKIIKCLHNSIVHGVISKAMNGSTQWHFMICVVLIYFSSFKNRWCIAPVITFSKIFSQWWYDIPKHVVFMHYMVVFDWDICIH